MSWFCPACLTRFDEPISRCPNDSWPPVEDLSHVVLAGRYTLQRLIGVGGMGSTVWLAKQTHIDRPVAVKLLPPGNEIPMRRFEREARIASNLRHPTIVTIYDYGPTDDGKLFLVMEYLEGQTLEQVLRTTACLPVERTLHIAVQVLRALSHAHSKRVVHRDLKPSNLFLTASDEDPDYVKVLDFGLAKYFVDEDASDVQSAVALDHDVTGQRQVVCGTPSYMAPEQWRGRIDARTDIYALGVILYRMLTGNLPFTGQPDYELYHRVITEEVPPLHVMKPDLECPPGLEAVVMKALAKDPRRRYGTAREMRADLERLRGREISIEVTPPVQVTGEDIQFMPQLPAGHPDDPEAVYLLSADALPEPPPLPMPEELSGSAADREAAGVRRRGWGVWIVGGIAALLLIALLVTFSQLGRQPATAPGDSADEVAEVDTADEPPSDGESRPAAAQGGQPQPASDAAGRPSGASPPEPTPPATERPAPTAPTTPSAPAVAEATSPQAPQPAAEPETPVDAPADPATVEGVAPGATPEVAPVEVSPETTEVAVRFETTPAGARVLAGGEARGTTPLVLAMQPGRYHFELELEGHETEALDVEVRATHQEEGLTHLVDLAAVFVPGAAMMGRTPEAAPRARTRPNPSGRTRPGTRRGTTRRTGSRAQTQPQPASATTGAPRAPAPSPASSAVLLDDPSSSTSRTPPRASETGGSTSGTERTGRARVQLLGEDGDGLRPVRRSPRTERPTARRPTGGKAPAIRLLDDPSSSGSTRPPRTQKAPPAKPTGRAQIELLDD